MARPDEPLDRRSFLSAVAGAGVLASASNVTGLFERWPLTPGAPAHAWPPQGRAFEIVVIGDSIMWGQGLSDDPAQNQKFTHKVQRFIQQRLPGTDVHLHNLAHSGAQILANADKDAQPATHGEIPNYFPSINWQLTRAVSELAGRQRHYVPPGHGLVAPESVGLVLMDGGINDLGTKKILTLDPTILSNPLDPASGAGWIRKATREQCVERMRSLLPKVLGTFPNAKVVVTNYYQIVSSHSDPKLLWELLRVWDVIGDELTLATDWAMKQLTAQSFAFHDELTRGLREVVPNARPIEMASRAGGLKLQAEGRTSRDVSAPVRRAAFAEIPFGPRNAYGAPETNLFILNEPDPAASVRKAECLERYGVLNPLCALAAGGHPNVRGAEVYADTIIAALKQLVPEWATTTPRVRQGA